MWKNIYSKAIVAIDGAGFDWSYMEDDEVPTNMALIAFLERGKIQVSDALGSPNDARKKDDEGVNKESEIDDQERPKNSTPVCYEEKTPEDRNTCLDSLVSYPEEQKDLLFLVQFSVPTFLKNLVLGSIGSGSSSTGSRPMALSLKFHMEKEDIGTKMSHTNQERMRDIEAIRLFLAYASFKEFVVYQMDVKSAFLYGKIEEEVYVCQPLEFEDSEFPDRVYKVEKALSGLHNPRAWIKRVPRKPSHGARSEVSRLHAVKRIFRYLKGQPKLGLWYPKDSPFDLEAYTDSEAYAGVSFRQSDPQQEIRNIADFSLKHLMLAISISDPMADETKNVESVPTDSNDLLLSDYKDQSSTREESASVLLKRRVKKLKRRRGRELTDSEDYSGLGREIVDLDADAEVTLVDEAQERNDDYLIPSCYKQQLLKLTLAPDLTKIKAAKTQAVTNSCYNNIQTAVTNPRLGVVVQEPSEFRTTTSSSQTSQLPQAKEKGKAKMVELEKPLKKKDQILIDEEIAQRLQEDCKLN
ncbi:ribonuclease H-like domain-containing protein [Tanacetum coccineum]|uniref:Ribonuclease H-like domain-containing protein n=1 Tax=Tanacetum coccineum TaxID=301880 RepID=A0ABQ5GY01_9ASTR